MSSSLGKYGTHTSNEAPRAWSTDTLPTGSANKRTRRVVRTDWGLLLVVLGLVLVGLVMVYSASYWFAFVEGGPYEGLPTYFVRRQAQFAGLGLVGMLIISRIDYRRYRKIAPLILAGTAGLLFLTLVVGILTPGSLGRYLRADQNSIQLSEVAKVGAIIYMAIWLASKGEDLKRLDLGVIPFGLLLGALAGMIIAQPDFSTGILLIVTVVAMFFVAGAEIKQMALIGLGTALTLILVSVVLISVVHYQPAVDRWARVQLWISNPLSDPLDEGFQVVQVLAALNRGGLTGVGLGQSTQKFAIYAPHSDCIIAIIGEETGLIGLMLVLTLYVLWAWRGYRIAWGAVDTYGRLLAVGLVTWVLAGAVLHTAVNTATTPFTGDVLPFISSGGSSLVSGLFSVGVLLNIARVSRGARIESASGGQSR